VHHNPVTTGRDRLAAPYDGPVPASATTSTILTDTVERLSTADSLDRITEIVAAATRTLMGSDGATFVLREDDKCFYADENAIGPLWKGSRFPLSACISGWAMMHRESVLIPDIYEDARVPIDAYRPTFVKSLAMVPIRREDPIGAVGAYWSTSYTPSREEVRLLEVLANSAAVALENLELRETVGRRSAERDELESAMHTLVHDLKGPLGAMLGYAELLEEGVSDPGKAQAFAHTIVTAGQRLEDQIQRMLGLYRITNTPLQPETVDLSVLGAEVAEQLQRHSERAVNIEIDSGMTTQMDPVLGRLMVQNLFENAFKYSARKADPTVWFRRVDRGTPLATFAIEDNGDGFDVSAADHLFTPGTRFHDESEFAGNGLGLASVARIVELHGGTIRAQAAKGAGATFFLGLPVPELAA
jgi:signal transduction histidine kinase